MKKLAYVLLADGFEEIEAITPIDVLRRAGIEVTTLSINREKTVKGAHNMKIIADDILEKYINSKADVIITPGGLPGSTNLRDNTMVQNLLQRQFRENRLIASICASPIALDAASILDEVTYTCYPGFEGNIKTGNYINERLCFDHNIITAQGPGVAFDFAFKIVETLLGKEIVENLKKETLV